ncbi:hypothetical protein, partial [Metapseudomonas otitidis]|uniref:hypothetical protein n=1 Tax=Metapseudomonas otitidis TaxID=319939 RepID=UPI00197FAD5F
GPEGSKGNTTFDKTDKKMSTHKVLLCKIHYEQGLRSIFRTFHTKWTPAPRAGMIARSQASVAQLDRVLPSEGNTRRVEKGVS